MYFDNAPCAVCGAEVRLTGAETSQGRHEPDATVDARICTNESCRTNSGDRDAPTP